MWIAMDNQNLPHSLDWEFCNLSENIFHPVIQAEHSVLPSTSKVIWSQNMLFIKGWKQPLNIKKSEGTNISVVYVKIVLKCVEFVFFHIIEYYLWYITKFPQPLRTTSFVIIHQNYCFSICWWFICDIIINNIIYTLFPPLINITTLNDSTKSNNKKCFVRLQTVLCCMYGKFRFLV